MESGYAGMTMDAVAAKCGISKRTLYQMYSSKLDLFAVLADEHRQAMLALPFEDDTVELGDALRRIFRMDIDKGEAFERMAMLRKLIDECARSPEIVAVLHEHGRDRSISYFTDWIARQVSLGRMVTPSPEHAAMIMLDMFFGAIFNRDKSLRDWDCEADRDAYLAECFRIFLEGVKPR